MFGFFFLLFALILRYDIFPPKMPSYMYDPLLLYHFWKIYQNIENFNNANLNNINLYKVIGTHQNINKFAQKKSFEKNVQCFKTYI